MILCVITGCRADPVGIESLGQFTLFPRDPLLQEGMLLQLDPLRDTGGPPLPELIQWNSSDNAIATVDANGLVTALASGTARISARAGPSADSITVTVQRGEGVSLEAFGDTNCGLTVSDGAVCWGANVYGATGTRIAADIVWTPTPVVATVSWRSIDGSYNHVCGVDTQFDIYCWGLNSVGQLGMGTSGEPVIPSSRVVGDRKYVTVSAGGAEWDPVTPIEINRAQQTCGLTREGEAFCWGQPGNPETSGETAASSPRAVAPGVRFASISAGNGFVCAVSIDRRVWCWGNNELGQLGRARAPFDRTPKPVDSELYFVRVSAGGIHACALAVDGSAWCWGANESMQLGSATTQRCNYRGRTVLCESRPVAVPGGHRYSVISAGSWGEALVPGRAFSGYNSHSCGITLAQTVVCWGWNSSNQVVQRLDFTEPLMIGPTLTPTEGVKFRDVSAGATHTCGVSVTNRGYCWWSGARGQQGVLPLEVGGFKALPSALIFR